MPIYLTTMFALPFIHLVDGGNAPLPNISPPSYATEDADATKDAGTQLLLVKVLCTVLAGQVHCHTSLSS